MANNSALAFLISGAVIGAFNGFIVGDQYGRSRERNELAVTPVHIAPLPAGYNRNVESVTPFVTIPATAVVHFLPMDEFDKLVGNRFDSKAWVSGRTHWSEGGGVCHVYLPASVWAVIYNHGDGTAVVESDQNDTLMHEMLHCMYGSWHPVFNKH